MFTESYSMTLKEERCLLEIDGSILFPYHSILIFRCSHQLFTDSSFKIYKKRKRCVYIVFTYYATNQVKLLHP